MRISDWSSDVCSSDLEPGIAAYGASKAAVLHLARIAAKEAAAYKVRVNAIAPAGVETPIWRGVPYFEEFLESMGSEAAAFAALAANSPLRRFARADQIAAHIGFLLSAAAATITAAKITRAGGYSLSPTQPLDRPTLQNGRGQTKQ